MPVTATTTSSSRRRLALLAGVLGYLAIAIAMFWHVLSVSATSGTTCACSDYSLFAWFFEWPVAAIRQGHDPFFSTAMFHPQGINLLSNTSVMGWTVLLAPITAAFGPIASLNVALIAAPVLGATSAMWLARRWVRSSAIAFVAGALYGFSPFVLYQEAGAHLMATTLIVPPLVLACLDELFVRRRHRPVPVGIALGLLVVVQFFFGTEMLTMLLVAAVLGGAVVAAGALVVDRDGALAALRAGLPGLVVAVVVAAALLAWPAWYALAGPQHYAGTVWPAATPAQASLRSFLVAVPGQGLWWVPHWGRFVRPTYVGPPLAAAIALGLVAFRRDRRLWAATAMAVVIAWLALGARYSFGLWHYLGHLPVLHNVMNERFSGLMFLPLGLALAIVCDHVAAWRPGRGAVGAACVAAACVTPFVLDATDALPYAASPVWQPTWYTTVGAHLPAGQVVLGFPFFNTSADLLSVQALHEMRWSVVAGTGPEWIAARAGKERPGYEVLQWVASTAATLPGIALGAPLPATATASQASEVRAALAGWGVTYVVDPVLEGFNTSVVARPPSDIERWMASVLGAPTLQSGAWVWHLKG